MSRRLQKQISFVIPAHNEELYIADCLGSVLEELRRRPCEAEIIVVNNASIDHTAAIARTFREILVIDEPTKGLARARQAGFMAATGELIANVDADTRLPRGWLDTVFGEFHRSSRLVALSGPFHYRGLPLVGCALVRLFYCLALAWHVVARYLTKRGAVLQGGNFVVRRSALAEIGGYDTHFAFYGEDTDVACRIRKCGEVKFTFRLGMSTDGRRLKAEGLLTMGVRYTLNHFWTILFKRPYTATSSDVR